MYMDTTAADPACCLCDQKYILVSKKQRRLRQAFNLYSPAEQFPFGDMTLASVFSFLLPSVCCYMPFVCGLRDETGICSRAGVTE
jgi:hypothetical protein